MDFSATMITDSPVSESKMWSVSVSWPCLKQNKPVYYIIHSLFLCITWHKMARKKGIWLIVLSQYLASLQDIPISDLLPVPIIGVMYVYWLWVHCFCPRRELIPASTSVPSFCRRPISALHPHKICLCSIWNIWLVQSQCLFLHGGLSSHYHAHYHEVIHVQDHVSWPIPVKHAPADHMKCALGVHHYDCF